MANEISLTAALSMFKPSIMSTAVGRAVSGLNSNMTANNWVAGTILVAITPGTAVPLGTVTAPHWAYFNNLDPANFVTLRNGVSGADLIKMLAGEVAFVPLLDSITTLQAIANTAACLMEYLIIGL